MLIVPYLAKEFQLSQDVLSSMELARLKELKYKDRKENNQQNDYK